MTNKQLSFYYTEGQIHKFQSNLEIECWRRLEKEISTEGNMFPVSWAELRRRWLSGKAAVAVHNSEIISYISLNEVFGVLEREYFFNIPGIDSTDIFPSSISCLSSGWTKRAYRKNNINYLLRCQLLENIRCKDDLVLSLCKGLGAGYVLKKIGFSLVSWEEFPFISAHICIFYRDSSYVPRVGWVSNMGKEPYMGVEINPYSEKYHDWDKYYYLWVEDFYKAKKIENNFKLVSFNDINFYHSIIVSMYCR